MNSSPPLLLLHDGGDNGVWDPVVERLPGFLDVAACRIPEGMPLWQASELVAARVRALGLAEPLVVGHGAGGAVALELARQLRISGVTAFCPFGFWTRSHAWYTAVRFGVMHRYADVWRYAFHDPGSITAPVLLAWARQDRVVPLTDAARARQRLPQARQVIVPSSGHLVMNDDPTTAAAVLFAWHQRISAMAAT